jgi:hypothetical protein
MRAREAVIEYHPQGPRWYERATFDGEDVWSKPDVDADDRMVSNNWKYLASLVGEWADALDMDEAAR